MTTEEDWKALGDYYRKRRVVRMVFRLFDLVLPARFATADVCLRDFTDEEYLETFDKICKTGLGKWVSDNIKVPIEVRDLLLIKEETIPNNEPLVFHRWIKTMRGEEGHKSTNILGKKRKAEEIDN